MVVVSGYCLCDAIGKLNKGGVLTSLEHELAVVEGIELALIFSFLMILREKERHDTHNKKYNDFNGFYLVAY